MSEAHGHDHDHGACDSESAGYTTDKVRIEALVTDGVHRIGEHDVDKKLSQPDWPTLVDYLLAMPLNLQPVHVAAFVHGLSDEQIADAIGSGTDNASAMRTDIEDYLARAGEAAC